MVLHVLIKKIKLFYLTRVVINIYHLVHLLHIKYLISKWTL